MSLKTRLRTRQKVFGAWTSLGHPSITEIFAGSGVDFVGIDLEHSTISQEQAQRIIAAAQAGGTCCLPRASSHNGEQIRRLFDSGADGVIVPMVSSVEEIDQIADWTKYPPLGKRSYGVARAHDYGGGFDRYTAEWNDRAPIVIQVESAGAIGVIDDLVSHDAVDGVMIGPYDLSGSLGVPGQIQSDAVKEACRTVIESCRRHGKGCGTQIVEPDHAAVGAEFEAGFTFVVLASDVFLLWKWSENMRSLIEDLRE